MLNAEKKKLKKKLSKKLSVQSDWFFLFRNANILNLQKKPRRVLPSIINQQKKINK